MNKTEGQLSGIYIHIPFCLRKCHYCDFLSVVADSQAYRAYKDALLKEIANTKVVPFDTIFIGGGTPSVLPPDHIAEILGEIGVGIEITLEANPATVTYESLTAYAQMGINRLSFGLQSANDTELEKLGRLHNYDEFRQNYFDARKAGFTNISVDIMHSLPGQSLCSWRDTLERVVELEPEHISAYGLMIEDGTVFANMRDEGKISIDERLDRQMYAFLCEFLNHCGYEHYEISNFAKPGFGSRHNKKYWTRAEYIGFGLGAHSFIDETRWRNTEIFDEYIANSDMPEKRRRDLTKLTKADAMAEYMFLGLRLRQGVSEEAFYEAFGMQLYSVYGEQINKHIRLKTLVSESGRVYLTDHGVSVSNVVMGDFL